jgi:hypothetical protein
VGEAFPRDAEEEQIAWLYAFVSDGHGLAVLSR